MAKIIYILIDLLLVFPIKSHATAADSIIFSKYAIEYIQPAPNLCNLQTIFRFWQNQDKGESDIIANITPAMIGFDSNLKFGNPLFHQHEAEPGYKLALEELRKQFDNRMTNPDSIAQEKRQLANSLTAMDTLLHNKPLLFQVIYKKYGGDITKYVDALYSRSFMTSEKLFKRMMRRTRPKLLVKDLGVNYALSMALYQVWLKQQNEEKNNDNNQ